MDHCFPSVAVEFTSRSTQRRDTGPKKDLYEKLGADELWLFDPFGEYLRPRLQGWRRDAGRFVGIRADEAGRLDSRALDASLREDGMRIVVVERDGTEMPPLSEVWELAASQSHRADQEAQRADQEARRADQEARRADQEARRAERMAERLRALGIPDDEP